jgi:hypothetical protein
MTHRRALIALAERLETATGPDRELDLAILNAVSAADSRDFKPWRWLDRERELITRDRYGEGAIGNPACSLEPFTSCLNAGLRLVEPIQASQTPLREWPPTIDIRRHDDETATVIIRESDTTPDDAEDEIFVKSQAKSLTLALPAAALRLKAAISFPEVKGNSV